MPLPLEDLEALCAQIRKRRPCVKTGRLEADLRSHKRTTSKNGGTTPLPMSEAIKRFIGRLKAEGECLNHPVSKSHRYPAVSIGGVQVKGNRFSWIIFRGSIPAGISVLHSCDNPACCNPDHLFLGTGLDNMRDRLAKGRYNTVPKGQDVNTSKLSPEQVIEIRSRLDQGEGLRPLGREYGVTHKAIYLIKNRKNWKHI